MRLIKSILLSVVILTISLYICTLDSYALSDSESEHTGYIYLGDSRFVGMNQYIRMDEMENTFVVAKVGEGLDWLQNTAASKIEEIMRNHPDIDNWVIISGLGINDCCNAEKYIEYYHGAFPSDNLILVSVNPVEESKCNDYGYDYGNLSTGAAAFNEMIKQTNYRYIDVYSRMMNEGFTTVDGVHYTEGTYYLIYDTIKHYLDEQGQTGQEE